MAIVTDKDSDRPLGGKPTNNRTGPPVAIGRPQASTDIGRASNGGDFS